MGTCCTEEILGGLGLTGGLNEHRALEGYGEIGSYWGTRGSLGSGCIGELLGGLEITGSIGGLLGGLEWGLGALGGYWEDWGVVTANTKGSLGDLRGDWSHTAERTGLGGPAGSSAQVY